MKIFKDKTRDVDYFIKKFQAIKPAKWTENCLVEKGILGESYCVMGLCGSTDRIKGTTKDSKALNALFEKILMIQPYLINDGAENPFTNKAYAKTPKGRIIKALRLIAVLQDDVEMQALYKSLRFPKTEKIIDSKRIIKADSFIKIMEKSGLKHEDPIYVKLKKEFDAENLKIKG